VDVRTRLENQALTIKRLQHESASAVRIARVLYEQALRLPEPHRSNMVRHLRGLPVHLIESPVGPQAIDQRRIR